MQAIFKRDFSAYFTSPIGYVYIASYIFALNLYFFLANILSASTSVSGIFSFMLLIMMFVTPILTMRVFSEDFKQKTDQLLLTAPVTSTSIVLGKFFSSLAVFGCLLAITVLWPIVLNIFGGFHLDEVVGNYIGIIGIGAAYISIGVFVSALTENQVIAAVGSLAIFVALFILEQVAMFFFASGVLPQAVMQIFLFISIFGRYGEITRGLLALDTMVFFISVCAFFLFLTTRVIEKRR
ncbi:MAG: ABC transporter permease subunit [Oscillospiraceae bacterium]|nr:ABC transporter permease subunit [Oscillospiraceae bacterium]